MNIIQMICLVGKFWNYSKMENQNKDNYDPVHVSGAAIFRYQNRATLGPFETRKIDLPLGNIYQKDEIFQQWRGHIINHSLFIEESVDVIISKLLFKKNIENIPLFRSVVLSREFFSFMNKWKVLRDLLKTFKPFKDRDYSELFNNLHKLIDERDKFAHGQVTYSGNMGENIYLEYFKETLKKEEITEENVKNFIDLSSKCRRELDKIIFELQEIQKSEDINS